MYDNIDSSRSQYKNRYSTLKSDFFCFFLNVKACEILCITKAFRILLFQIILCHHLFTSNISYIHVWNHKFFSWGLGGGGAVWACVWAVCVYTLCVHVCLGGWGCMGFLFTHRYGSLIIWLNTTANPLTKGHLKKRRRKKRGVLLNSPPPPPELSMGMVSLS